VLILEAFAINLPPLVIILRGCKFVSHFHHLVFDTLIILAAISFVKYLTGYFLKYFPVNPEIPLDIFPQVCYIKYTMNNIKAIRESQGMTQRDLSDKTGITEGHIGNIESGRNDCTAEKAKKIAEVLGVTLDELLSEPKSTETAHE